MPSASSKVVSVKEGTVRSKISPKRICCEGIGYCHQSKNRQT